MVPNERSDAKIRIGVAVSDTVNDPIHTWHGTTCSQMAAKHTLILPDTFTDSMTAHNDCTDLLNIPKL